MEDMSEHQQQLLIDHAFMLETKVQKAARPRLIYTVNCFTCGREGRVEAPARKALDQKHVHAGLIVQGWLIGSRGFQCPTCYERDITAMVEAASDLAGEVVEDAAALATALQHTARWINVLLYSAVQELWKNHVDVTSQSLSRFLLHHYDFEWNEQACAAYIEQHPWTQH